jgi:hypothetical protein
MSTYNLGRQMPLRAISDIEYDVICAAQKYNSSSF